MVCCCVCGSVSCVISSGVFWSMLIGMCGQKLLKHRGCHESPRLVTFFIRHSLPTSALLQIPQVALWYGMFFGFIVVEALLGSAIDRLRLLLV